MCLRPSLASLLLYLLTDHSMTYRFWVSLLFVVTCAVSWALGSWAGYRDVEQDSFEEAFRYSQLVATELNRYYTIPELLAEHPLFQQVLLNPLDQELVLSVNEEMRRMASIVGNSDVYLLNRYGLTIAANTHELETRFIGYNFGFRPYYYEAMISGKSAFYSAIGITSSSRGLYFSHAIKARDDSTRTIGIIVLKVQVNELESQWRRLESFNEAEMVVLDSSGVVFLASRQDWLFKAFEPISAEERKLIEDEKRYPNQPLTPMNLVELGKPMGVSDRSERVSITAEGVTQEYLSVETSLPQLDWRLRVLTRTQKVLWSQVWYLVAGTLLFLGGFLTWLYLRERYRREAELAQRGEMLERNVAERTADLEATNQRLVGEIRERERAQEELKETQQGLIQAAKLAVLGQMSAGLNHEMNQPLTAIQAYARNSRRFLERGDQATVDANLEEIVNLCDKMAELTRQFKVFARKSEGPPNQVDLRQPIEAALKIITAQENSHGVDIQWTPPAEAPLVHGDLIRIEQVLVNLITNAIQAVEASPSPTIHIELEERENQWLCRVWDNGPGLPANTEQVFEPFFTTKSLKQGLGLGLSISRQIVDALGGRLTGQNRADGQGAEFTLMLNKREDSE